jgi:hypothetical protein
VILEVLPMVNDRGESDQDAKASFIRAYFDDLVERSAFLEELAETGHEKDALLLCCCYIEGIANHLYWPESHAKQNFVRVLTEHSQCEVLSWIHPDRLRRSLDDLPSDMRGKLASTLKQTESRLYSQDGIRRLLSQNLTAEEMAKVRNQLWRGTVAAIAYEHIRSQFVHWLGGPNSVTFDDTTFKGAPVPSIGLPLLQRALTRILQAAKHVSVSTNRWYGHDLRSAAG